jgi:hypothetical protein
MKSSNTIRVPNYAACRRRAMVGSAYPNAASTRYHLDKLLENLLGGASIIALAVSIMFAFVLWG